MPSCARPTLTQVLRAASQAAADGVPLERLKQAGGWNIVQMPVRYINDSAVANKGMGRNKKEA